MKVAYVTNGRTVVGWYRGALPALYSGADWFGIVPEAPTVVATQITRTPWEQRGDYDVIVWAQPLTQQCRDEIRALRAGGTKVIVEVDDYLAGVAKMPDHDFKDRVEFGKKSMQKFEQMISVCDGLIVSTEFLKRQYGRLNDKTFVCLNGLDLARYDKGRVPHPTVNIGWAGATGHAQSFQRVAQAVADVLNANERTSIITVGQGFAEAYANIAKSADGQDRYLSLPFSSLETYTNAMSLFDIALAPARNTGWYRAKSALRYYEAAALGIPTIGDPLVYGEIEHGVTGLLVEGEDDWFDMLDMLVKDDEMRIAMGHAARKKAWTEFDMTVRVQKWQEAIAEVMAA
jgi:glycosyltransferase involved in cell wall biosynthesis